MDFNRATRETKSLYEHTNSSVRMLEQLKRANINAENVHIGLFSPKMSHSWYTPMFENYGVKEIRGTYHTKFLVFDNTVILTGANLSEEYFLGRKDRYLMIDDCPELANYLEDFLEVFMESGVEYGMGNLNEPGVGYVSRYNTRDLKEMFGLSGSIIQ